MAVKDSFFNYNDTIGSEDGLNFAFAITEYDNNPESIEDPRFGQMRAKIVSWGFSEDQEVDIDGGIIQSHTCT